MIIDNCIAVSKMYMCLSTAKNKETIYRTKYLCMENKKEMLELLLYLL